MLKAEKNSRATATISPKTELEFDAPHPTYKCVQVEKAGTLSAAKLLVLCGGQVA
jgi:hypothetical protein